MKTEERRPTRERVTELESNVNSLYHWLGGAQEFTATLEEYVEYTIRDSDYGMSADSVVDIVYDELHYGRLGEEINERVDAKVEEEIDLLSERVKEIELYLVAVRNGETPDLPEGWT